MKINNNLQILTKTILNGVGIFLVWFLAMCSPVSHAADPIYSTSDPGVALVEQLNTSINNMTRDMTTQLGSKMDGLTAATQSLSENIATLVKLTMEMKETNQKQLQDLYLLTKSNQDDLIKKLYSEFPGLERSNQELLMANNSVLSNLSVINELQSKQLNFELYAEGVQNKTAYKDVVGEHYVNYCDKNSTNEAKVFKGCKVSPDFAHADLKLSSLLVPTNYTNPQEAAAKIFMRNLIKPFNSSVASDIIKNASDVVEGDEKKTQMLAEALINEATLSAARHSLTTSYLYRLPGGDENKKTPSVMEVMETEATRRFKETDWSNNIKTASYAAVLRELAHMQAFQIWLEYQRYRQMERVEASLAAQMASNQLLLQEVKKGNEQAQITSNQANERAREQEKARQRSQN